MADFVVIGGGFAGLSAARRLTQIVSDAKVVVLEAGRIAEGATGRNSGFMIDLPHELQSENYAGGDQDRALISLNRKAQGFAAEAVDEYDIDPAFYDRSGKINGAATEAAHHHNLSYARHLENLGEASELLDAQAMREQIGTTYYRSGLYTPGTVLLQPAGYIRGLADGLRRAGVEIYENSPVTGFSQTGRNWKVETATARVSAGRILLCVNGFLESFGVEQSRLMQLFLFASMTPNLDAETRALIRGSERWGITPSDPMGTTIRRIDAAQGGPRIVVRTCAVLRSGMRARSGDLKRAARVMQQKFDSRFPALAGMAMEHKWAGHLCLSQNGVTVTREIAEGVFSACVQNGLGTARGTMGGIAAAERACGLTSDFTRFFESEAPPSRLVSQPVRDLGANAVLRWKEWKARAE